MNPGKYVLTGSRPVFEAVAGEWMDRWCADHSTSLSKPMAQVQ